MEQRRVVLPHFNANGGMRQEFYSRTVAVKYLVVVAVHSRMYLVVSLQLILLNKVIAFDSNVAPQWTVPQEMTNQNWHGNTVETFWNNANDSKLSLTPPPDLASCFAKLRLAADLLPEFGADVDRQAKIGRLDSIKRIFDRMISKLCNEAEKEKSNIFFEEHTPAIKIAETVWKNLSNSEKDQLNVWINMMDTESEREMFTSKLNALPQQELNLTRKSTNEILGLFSKASMKPYQASFFSQFSENDLNQLKEFLKENAGDLTNIKAMTTARFRSAPYTAEQRQDIIDYLTKLARFSVNSWKTASDNLGQYSLKNHRRITSFSVGDIG